MVKRIETVETIGRVHVGMYQVNVGIERYAALADDLQSVTSHCSGRIVIGCAVGSDVTKFSGNPDSVREFADLLIKAANAWTEPVGEDD